tara:strand:- start:981 stop:3260 length:2280 start_codon:yes stop_codon:yes gene_type:complete
MTALAHFAVGNMTQRCHKRSEMNRLRPILCFVVLLGCLVPGFERLVAADGSLNSPNHLAQQQSPYLLQHLDNPVEWYVWGAEAFDRARQEQKPIFLSIGYSTCHWCHVMERESFMDPATAQILNENFINIKVDREERPDIDRIYMSYVQAATGRGGWPLSVWLTPSLEPFYGGTYFPVEASHRRASFKQVLKKMVRAWEEDPDGVEQAARASIESLRMSLLPRSSRKVELTEQPLSDAELGYRKDFDPNYGGFGRAPKFPSPGDLQFLHCAALRQGLDSSKGTELLEMSLKTLRQMANGGIYDHLGGGFHRYSVDRFWHVPHFEKMLYDQAQLVSVYLEAYLLTKDPFYAEVARDVLRYVGEKMTDPNGGFYSAEDADSDYTHDSSEHGEGVVYLWEKREIDALLGADAELFNFIYGIKEDGNAPRDPHGYFVRQNILNRRVELAAAAAVAFDQTPEQIEMTLQRSETILRHARAQRPQPHLDDKQLTAWNGLMISAYARAYRILGDVSYLQAATRAAEFLQQEVYRQETGTLLRSYRKGPSTIEGFATDYAFLIHGLIGLYEAGFDVQWLRLAESLQIKQDALFWDMEQGGYYASLAEDSSVILRIKDANDGAIPSANSLSALNLQRLSAMLDRPQWDEQARRIFDLFSDRIERTPRALPQMMLALDFSLQKPTSILLAGELDAADTKELLAVVNETLRPHSVLLLADGGLGQSYLSQKVEIFKDLRPIDGQATAYICEDFTCKMPTTSAELVREQLK